MLNDFYKICFGKYLIITFSTAQVVIVPCGMTVNLAEDKKQSLLTFCKEFCQQLTEAGVRAKLDDRDNYSPGWKFNHWELKVSFM